ncbi:MAG: DUF4388 domain-containing protein [Chloroflexota bacterium]|nr:DUF4388 domain-containing protein [Chloroflexota bacterium]
MHAMKMRGTATDKLADVIQMLLFVHKTGILTVQRENSTHSLEEGSLFLREGQIADAAIGNLRGVDALKKLNTWTKCYFVFQALSPSASSPLAPPASAPLEQPPERQTRPLLPATASSSVIPCRTQQFQENLPDFDRLGVSRIHRQLFLLADGQRSIETLAKLLGRQPQEVLLLLRDLENLHLLRRL